MNTVTYTRGNIVDVVNRTIFKGTVEAENGKIKRITPGDVPENQYIVPGLTDAHIHIESSMLIPSSFARMACVHGTTACVSDPHELANVMGTAGVRFMIDNAAKVPFRFYFGAPSCVPATGFETSGAAIDSEATETLLQMPEIRYLAEMMNFPGVVFGDAEVHAKIALAHKYGKVVDGHAPGLSGEQLKAYAAAGITTDHECFTLSEAEEKIALGMKILIREGSAAKNFEDLIPLMATHPEHIMLCSDDKHPDDLLEGHLNLLVKRCIAKGYDIFDILRSVSYNPIKHYSLEPALLQEGDNADFIVVDNLTDFNVRETIIGGRTVASLGTCLMDAVSEKTVNVFNCEPLSVENIAIKPQTDTIRVIRALEGQLITQAFTAPATVVNDNVVSNTGTDILKMVVLQRYRKSTPAVAFINGFGLKSGAMAGTIAHDSHNIIAVGTSDEEIVHAINTIIAEKGGVCAVNSGTTALLPLPFGGLMTNADALEVAQRYKEADAMVKRMGGILNAPFMTLAFMALLVIPDLKLNDKGLFDGTSFSFTDLFV